MAIKNGTGWAYKGDVQTWSVYEVHVDGVVVLEAAIDNADPELKIFVGKQGATFAQVQVGIEGQLTETKGRAVKAVYGEGDACGNTVPDGLTTRIVSRSVQSYVLPRVLRFVTKLYVAKIDLSTVESTEKPAS